MKEALRVRDQVAVPSHRKLLVKSHVVSVAERRDEDPGRQ